MKVLGTEWTTNRWSFQQIARDGPLAIFKKSRIGYDVTNDCAHYEIVVIRNCSGGTLEDGTYIEPMEVYPDSESWGTYGWSRETLQSAQEKLEWLKQRIETMDTNANITEAAKSKNENSSNRGRPRLEFKFPTGEFKIRELAEKNRVSIPFVILKIKEAGERVKELRKEKPKGQRGRAATVYKYEAPEDSKEFKEGQAIARNLMQNLRDAE